MPVGIASLGERRRHDPDTARALLSRGGPCRSGVVIRLPVIAVYVSFSVARGWQGGTKYYWRSRALHYMDRATSLAAGRAGEELFDCPAHYSAWLADLSEISVLLNAKGISEDEHWARVTEARERARLILKTTGKSPQVGQPTCRSWPRRWR